MFRLMSTRCLCSLQAQQLHKKRSSETFFLWHLELQSRSEEKKFNLKDRLSLKHAVYQRSYFVMKCLIYFFGDLTSFQPAPCNITLTCYSTFTRISPPRTTSKKKSLHFRSTVVKERKLCFSSTFPWRIEHPNTLCLPEGIMFIF